jgi:hypothetical protein
MSAGGSMGLRCIAFSYGSVVDDHNVPIKVEMLIRFDEYINTATIIQDRLESQE